MRYIILVAALLCGPTLKASASEPIRPQVVEEMQPVGLPALPGAPKLNRVAPVNPQNNIRPMLPEPTTSQGQQVVPRPPMPMKTIPQPLEAKEYSDFVAGFEQQKYMLKWSSFLKKVKDEKTVIIDLRSQEAYQKAHIKNAIHLGADVNEKRLAEIIPNKDTTIVLYCSNSLYPMRMISLTDVTLPQFHKLGYTQTYKADALWRFTSNGGDAITRLKAEKLWQEQVAE